MTMSRLHTVFLFTVLASLLVVPVQADENPNSLETARRSVVSVLPVWPGLPPDADEPEGSGVILEGGTIVVTADHVLGPAGVGEVKVMVRDSDGMIIPARVKLRNRATDIAVLQLQQPLAPIARRPAEEALIVSEPVCAIGNAFGMGLSVTCGHVSAVNRAGVGFNGIEDFIQTDAAVNPGMSGGALVDRQGRFVGLLSAIFTKQSDANIGVNFAIHSRLVDEVLVATADGGPFMPFKTGVLAQPIPARGEAGREAIRVVRLVLGSAGERAGLQPGDQIFEAGNRRIRKPQDWLSVMAQVRPGGEISVRLYRQGKEVEAVLRRD